MLHLRMPAAMRQLTALSRTRALSTTRHPLPGRPFSLHPRPRPSPAPLLLLLRGEKQQQQLLQPHRHASSQATSIASSQSSTPPPPSSVIQSHSKHSHAVISAFDLFSIGVGPSSSHTVGPWRAANIFIEDLEKLGMTESIATLKITLYGSLAATGQGHGTVEALLMGFQGYDCETVDTAIVQPNFKSIVDTKTLALAGKHKINFSMDDIRWRYDTVLPEHPNGMAFSVYDKNGDLLALNEYFSVGGGFVVTPRSIRVGGENVFYKQTNREQADPARRQQNHGVPAVPTQLSLPGESKNDTPPVEENEQTKWALPPLPFACGQDLLEMCKEHDMTIAQVCWENERHYLTDEEIKGKTLRLWRVMDACIREGVSHPEGLLPGSLRLKRRAPGLYKRLMRGFYPGLLDTSQSPSGQGKTSSAPGSSPSDPGRAVTSAVTPGSATGVTFKKLRGKQEHPLPPIPPRNAVFPAMDFLSAYAIAVNEVNAAGGRIVTAPTNGAAGVIPAVCKYITEFISHDPERDVLTFLLTASAIGMLFKRGATISASEGGCMAEVGVASAMAAGGYVACMGGTPEQVLQAAEIAIEHSMGLTCDPIGGYVQAPCIERNAIGAVKAVTAAQLALSGDGEHLITLDDAIVAMRNTAQDMHSNYKETSLGGLATSVKIPVSVPNC